MVRWIGLPLVLIATGCWENKFFVRDSSCVSEVDLRKITMTIDNGFAVHGDTTLIIEDGKVIDWIHGFKIEKETECLVEAINESRDTITVNFGSNWCEEFYSDLRVQFVAKADGWKPSKVLRPEGFKVIEEASNGSFRFSYRGNKSLPRLIKIEGKEATQPQ